MTTISNMPHDLLKEILCRVPMTSLRAMRSTCKLWNTLLKNPLSMRKASKEIMFITIYDHQASLRSVDPHENKDLVDPFMKQIGELKEVKLYNVFHCSGLLLCLTYEGFHPRLLVWNPYSGNHTSWIEPRKTEDFRTGGRHIFGMGYDSNNNLKILQFSYWLTHIDCEIYDLKSRSWRVLGISMDWNIYEDGVSLKGDNYFFAYERLAEVRNCIICFDFTRESVWKISLPYHFESQDFGALSVVSEEKLAVLYRKSGSLLEMEIWITNKIELPNAVSWSYFLKIDHIPPYRFCSILGSFFIDEKKKIAVICDADYTKGTSYKASIVGEGGHCREMELGNIESQSYMFADFRCSTYVPSLMQIQ